MTPAITGHRGARNEAPENTLEGFRHARALGVDTIECDIRLTRDGHAVVIHDATVDRTTDGTGAVADLTLAEVQALDARAGHDWPRPCRIPTLAEMLDDLGDSVRLWIEVKADEPARMEALIGLATQEVAARGLVGSVTWTSFDHTALEILRRIVPDLPRGLIGAWDGLAWIDDARRLGCAQADINLTTSSAEIVAAAHDAGLRVVAWPCNTAEALATAIAWGVDAVTTDEPTRLMRLAGRVNAG